jgi:hypothetical protein
LFFLSRLLAVLQLDPIFLFSPENSLELVLFASLAPFSELPPEVIDLASVSEDRSRDRRKTPFSILKTQFSFAAAILHKLCSVFPIGLSQIAASYTLGFSYIGFAPAAN